MPRPRAAAVARALTRLLEGLKGLRRREVAGSFRRRSAEVGDLDFLACGKDPAAVVARFLSYPGKRETVAEGPTRAAMRLRDGFQVDLRVVPEEDFGAALLYFTGSKAHNVALRGLARRRGLKLNEYGLFRDGRRLAGRSEEEVYAALGLRWIPPPRRENQGEIEAAALGRTK
jgi:DNA polymerase (family 10)